MGRGVDGERNRDDKVVDGIDKSNWMRTRSRFVISSDDFQLQKFNITLGSLEVGNS